MTVKHLQTLQRQQLAAAIAADPAVLSKFRSGFGDCAVEVRRYLSRLASVPTGLRHRLGNHLTSCISGIERLTPFPGEHPPLIPDPLRLDGDRPSAFHYVKSTKPTSPPLSPISCDSACDSSTELETPPRPFKSFTTTYPTPPSRSASDQDSSPETQKPTVSSTTISPESLKQQELLKSRKYTEPLSIVIDVENYKIGIDASPKRAVDYSVRHKLKRPTTENIGPVPKLLKIEHVADRPSAFVDAKLVKVDNRFLGKSLTSPEKRNLPQNFENRLRLPESIPSILEIPSNVVREDRGLGSPAQRSVISHTAESLARSSRVDKEKVEPSASRSSEQSSSSSSDAMWRPW